jgi:hypothetical protein
MADNLQRKINPLKFLPHTEHKKFSNCRPNWFMVFREIIVVCSEMHTECTVWQEDQTFGIAAMARIIIILRDQVRTLLLVEGHK